MHTTGRGKVVGRLAARTLVSGKPTGQTLSQFTDGIGTQSRRLRWLAALLDRQMEMCMSRRDPMRRRDFLGAGAGIVAGALVLAPARLEADNVPMANPEGPFDAALVRRLAHELAQKPFKPPSTKLPDDLAKAEYDAYRTIRFKKESALWADDKDTFFRVEFFHRGFLYKERVDIYEVVNGQSKQVHYSPDMFEFGKLQRPSDSDLGFAGFRIHAPFVKPDYADEVCSFLGASYFRAVAKGQGYGLSARGLAVNTAEPGGEEFPIFRAFWLERPAPGARSMVIHALLDSDSVASAFRFTLRPGDDTTFDVESVNYPRKDIAVTGIAPLTSMFMFDASKRVNVDDYRPGVHDSAGLALAMGSGEQIWRPLANPTDLQVSMFADTNPRGFGLMQRNRSFFDYQDLEAHYEKRPSLWVEPIGDWGAGGIELVEIPSPREIHDNIVAFWRPKDPFKANGEYGFVYRLHWCWSPPGRENLAQVASTRGGLAWDQKGRLFVIDFVGDPLRALSEEAPPKLEVTTDKGAIKNAVAAPNPETKGWRISFELSPDGKSAELRARLHGATAPLSETWVYRWTT
jgi:periplasmic glucans biosynthesis protein